ncbi:MAG: hypothetical protein Kow0059_11930 [Candidatus Sumerlaeia bacterium]
MTRLRSYLTALAAVLALRLWGAAAAPLLSSEAYYWLWGQHPAWGYYDHPPMVAWEAAAFGGWIRRSETAARAGALVFGALAALAVWALARALFSPKPTDEQRGESARAAARASNRNDRNGDQSPRRPPPSQTLPLVPSADSPSATAGRAAVLLLVLPIFYLNGLLLMPDNGLVLFMTLAWWAFWRAAEGGREGRRAMLWWALAGTAAGGALLSKFHAWVLLPPLWGFLALSPAHRRVWRGPGPWLAALLAVLIVSPNLIWNARHDWANYAYQWRRSDLPEFHFNWLDPLIFLAGPLVSLTPPGAALAGWGAWRGWRRWRRDGEARALFLLCAGLPLVVLLGALSFVVTISLHWPAAGYLPLVLLGMGELERTGTAARRMAYGLTLGVAAGAVALMHLGALALPVMPPSWPLAAKALRKSVGWREAGELAARRREALDSANGPAAPALIMGKSWHSASLLAFYSGRPDEAFVLTAADAHNYRFWMNDRGGLAGADAVIVLEFDSRSNYPTWEAKTARFLNWLAPLFERVEFREALACYRDGRVAPLATVNPLRPVWREFLVFEAHGFRGRLADRLP